MEDRVMDIEDPLHRLGRKRSRLTLAGNSEFVELANTFNNVLRTMYLKKGEKEDLKDICLLLVKIKNNIKNEILSFLTTYGQLKFNILIECSYHKSFTGESQPRAFKTSNEVIVSASPIDAILHNMFTKLCKEEQNSYMKGSGWSLHFVDGVMLRLSRYTPMGGAPLSHSPKDRIKTSLY